MTIRTIRERRSETRRPERRTVERRRRRRRRTCPRSTWAADRSRSPSRPSWFRRDRTWLASSSTVTRGAVSAIPLPTARIHSTPPARSTLRRNTSLSPWLWMTVFPITTPPTNVPVAYDAPVSSVTVDVTCVVALRHERREGGGAGPCARVLALWSLVAGCGLCGGVGRWLARCGDQRRAPRCSGASIAAPQWIPTTAARRSDDSDDASLLATGVRHLGAGAYARAHPCFWAMTNGDRRGEPFPREARRSFAVSRKVPSRPWAAG